MERACPFATPKRYDHDGGTLAVVGADCEKERTVGVMFLWFVCVSLSWWSWFFYAKGG